MLAATIRFRFAAACGNKDAQQMWEADAMTSMEIAGYVVLALILIGIAVNLGDIRRYIRISRM